jgi:hypothetical protein
VNESPSSKTVGLTGQGISTSTGRVSMSTTAFLSGIYTLAAERFAKLAADLDDETRFNAADQFQRNRIATELQETSLASVIMASLAVEAMINELFLEHRLFGRPPAGLSEEIARALSTAFTSEIEWAPPLVKCQIALAIARRRRMEFGKGIGQEMDLLIKLRNVLLHHKPVTVVHGFPADESNDQIERRLAKKFPLAKIFGSTAPFRWSGCLGSGCAEWASKTSKAFQQGFVKQLGDASQ